jgi:hypothetical protein
VHEAHGRATLDAIDQHVGELLICTSSTGAAVWVTRRASPPRDRSGAGHRLLTWPFRQTV